MKDNLNIEKVKNRQIELLEFYLKQFDKVSLSFLDKFILQNPEFFVRFYFNNEHMQSTIYRFDLHGKNSKLRIGSNLIEGYVDISLIIKDTIIERRLVYLDRTEYGSLSFFPENIFFGLESGVSDSKLLVMLDKEVLNKKAKIYVRYEDINKIHEKSFSYFSNKISNTIKCFLVDYMLKNAFNWRC